MLIQARKITRPLNQLKSVLVVLILLFAATNLQIPTTNSVDVIDSDILQINDDSVSPNDIYTTAINMSAVDYITTNSKDSFHGYTLFNFYKYETTTRNITNNVMIMDQYGNIVAQRNLGSRGGYDCAAEFIDPNTVLVGTEWGAALWHLENDTLQFLNFNGHHEFEYNPNSNTFFSLSFNKLNISGIDYRFDYIREYTMNGTMVWELDVHNFISENWWCPSHDMASIYRDISHSNTVFYDAEEDIIYYNSRNTNTFFKINHTNSEVIWGLGEYGDFTMYDIHGRRTDHLFFHAHSVEKIDDSTFILFDNDYHNQTSAGSRKSRILEITVNEDTMVARESWYYIAPSDYFSAGWGDADRLPNGNRIGCWGYPSSPSSGLSAALVEVNPEGKIVWQTRFMVQTPYMYGSYRLERFRYEPILNSPPDVTRLRLPGNITWDVRFNYRNKEPLPGNYTLYIDDVQAETGDFTYAKFWNPTSLDISYGDLSLGAHNITLAVSDGYGNTATDTVILTIQDFIISRSGYTILEKGQQEHLTTWIGSTVSELSGNITLNGVLFMDVNWNGEDIVIDPDLIAVGDYLLEFNLYNGTLHVYNDSCWLQITPAAPPVIVPLQPVDVIYNWSDPQFLSWDLYDVTAHSWALLVNGSTMTENTWSPTSYIVNWKVPLLEPALYNITLLVDDDIGQVSSDECLLTIPPPDEPFIVSSPGNSTETWGSEGVSFIWEIVGGTQWSLYRNSELLATDTVSGFVVEIDIDDWRSESWRPGLYNLTLANTLETVTVVDTIWVNIVVNPGDPYVDEFLPDYSQSYLIGENAVGAPDGLYTTLYPAYEDGYVTLDMGRYEEIVNGTGSDFTVEAQGGSYRVYVSNSLETVFKFLGTGTGQASFDLEGSGLNMARYVRIQYNSGDDVELDAIVAINYSSPPADTSPPIIGPIDNVTSMELGTSTILRWFGVDDTPWSYEIYENGVLAESEFWYGSDIEYLFEPLTIGQWNITLVVYDAFNNTASDTILIQVLRPANLLVTIGLIVGGVAIGAVVIVFVTIQMKKKNVS